MVRGLLWSWCLIKKAPLSLAPLHAEYNQSYQSYRTKFLRFPSTIWSRTKCTSCIRSLGLEMSKPWGWNFVEAFSASATITAQNLEHRILFCTAHPVLLSRIVYQMALDAANQKKHPMVHNPGRADYSDFLHQVLYIKTEQSFSHQALPYFRSAPQASSSSCRTTRCSTSSSPPSSSCAPPTRSTPSPASSSTTSCLPGTPARWPETWQSSPSS